MREVGSKRVPIAGWRLPGSCSAWVEPGGAAKIYAGREEETCRLPSSTFLGCSEEFRFCPPLHLENLTEGNQGCATREAQHVQRGASRARTDKFSTPRNPETSTQS